MIEHFDGQFPTCSLTMTGLLKSRFLGSTARSRLNAHQQDTDA